MCALQIKTKMFPEVLKLFTVIHNTRTFADDQDQLKISFAQFQCSWTPSYSLGAVYHRAKTDQPRPTV